MTEKYQTDSQGNLFICLHCGEKNEFIDKEDVHFCIYCGYALKNICTNFGECGQFLPPYAAYCPYCGSESHFLNSGLVKSKRKPIELKDDELPF